MNSKYFKVVLVLLPLVVVAFFQFGYNTTIYSTAASSQSAVDAPWAYQNQNQQNTGYSPQNMINSTNVGSLQQVWATPLAGLAGTPVVWNGMVFVTGNGNSGDGSIYAVSESTGDLIWQDTPSNTGLNISTAAGLTIANGNIFADTSNNLLVSINALTGAVNWNVSVVNNIIGSPNGYLGPEGTPLVLNGKVIVGNTAGDPPIASRGLLRAFNEKNGKLIWTFYTVPPSPMNATDQKGYKQNGQNTWPDCSLCTGGAVWNVPSVDPHSGIIYFATGNPYPNVRDWADRVQNANDTNLYTNSVIALNSTNGKMIWYYQEDPSDWGDHDLGMPTMLFNTTINGVQTEVLADVGKYGVYFEFNALTGAVIYSVPVGKHLNSNLVSNPKQVITNEPVFPGANGGVNTFSTFDPTTNMVYTVAWNSWQVCSGNLSANTMRCLPQPLQNSTLEAINTSTGVVVWNMSMPGYGIGVSSTNDIVFTGNGNHTFYALNGYTGQILWQQNDTTGDGALWAWGPPAITNGMIFITTMGNVSGGAAGPDGQLEAYAIPYPTQENAMFTEAGLPIGQTWNVTFDGTVYSSNTSSITVNNITSAIHYWSVGTVPNGTGIRYFPSPNNGTLPSQSTQFTFLINFQEQYQVKFGVNPGKSGTTTPKQGAFYWYNAGSVVSISATPNGAYTFTRWTKNTNAIVINSKTDPSTTATINGPGKITAVFIS